MNMSNQIANMLLSMLGIHATYIGNTGAVVLGMVYEYLPFMVLPIYTVMSKIDGGLIEAAQDLGSNSFAVFRKVVFPLSIPGVISGITNGVCAKCQHLPCFAVFRRNRRHYDR